MHSPFALQFIIEPTQGAKPQPSALLPAAPRPPVSAPQPPSPSPEAPSPTDASGSETTAPPPREPPILLQPLVSSWSAVRYTHLRCLHVWNVDLADDCIVALVSRVRHLLHSYVQSVLARRPIRGYKVEPLRLSTQALFIESPLGVNLKVLELMETRLSSWAMNRIARYMYVMIVGPPGHL